jgi:hypothetical protein
MDHTDMNLLWILSFIIYPNTLIREIIVPYELPIPSIVMMRLILS